MNAPPRREQDGGLDGMPASTPSAASTATPASTTPDWPQDVLAADGAGPTRGARGLRRRHLAVAALLAVACAVVAIVLVGGRHGRGGMPDTGVPAGDTTAMVERRTLTESSTVDGTLGYGAALELYDRLSGTFTWLPPVGATIARGGTLFRLDNLPVVLMYGTVPAYRALRKDVSDGPDVAQLNRNLIDLGYDPYGAIADLRSFQRSDRCRRAPLAESRGPPRNRRSGTRPGRVRARRPSRHHRARHARTGPPGRRIPARRQRRRGRPFKRPQLEQSDHTTGG